MTKWLLVRLVTLGVGLGSAMSCGAYAAREIQSASGLGGSISQSASPHAGTHRTRRRLKPGMVVLDRHGATVGIIERVGETMGGRAAVLLRDNGARFRVRVSKLKLTRNGEEAVTSLTRSRIRTSAILNTE